jgi:uncharacterized membrane protein
MIRKHLKPKSLTDNEFQFRGLDNTRVEALSDGVFALAIALLLISSEVPNTFNELREFLKNFFPFAATISILTLIWYQHYIFFVRYGLKDASIVAINTLLLFLVLFFVYPLKFLFQVLFALFSALIMNDQKALEILFSEVIKANDAPTLMVIYGAGSALVFLTMAWMYFIALKRRAHLKLSPIEVFDTRSNIYTNLCMASIPFISSMISILGIGGGGSLTFSIAGLFYMSYIVVMPLYGYLRARTRQRFLNPSKN